MPTKARRAGDAAGGAEEPKQRAEAAEAAKGVGRRPGLHHRERRRRLRAAHPHLGSGRCPLLPAERRVTDHRRHHARERQRRRLPDPTRPPRAHRQPVQALRLPAARGLRAVAPAICSTPGCATRSRRACASRSGRSRCRSGSSASRPASSTCSTSSPIRPRSSPTATSDSTSRARWRASGCSTGPVSTTGPPTALSVVEDADDGKTAVGRLFFTPTGGAVQGPRRRRRWHAGRAGGRALPVSHDRTADVLPLPARRRHRWHRRALRAAALLLPRPLRAHVRARHLGAGDPRRGASASRVENSAWQVTGTWVLSGEKATFRGVKPAHDFDLARDSLGRLAAGGAGHRARRRRRRLRALRRPGGVVDARAHRGRGHSLDHERRRCA